MQAPQNEFEKKMEGYLKNIAPFVKSKGPHISWAAKPPVQQLCPDCNSAVPSKTCRNAENFGRRYFACDHAHLTAREKRQKILDFATPRGSREVWFEWHDPPYMTRSEVKDLFEEHQLVLEQVAEALSYLNEVVAGLTHIPELEQKYKPT
jgi:hypothetical protein